MLNECGFEVVADFDDGLKLLHHMETTPTLPDLVLSDLEMPGMNGIGLTEEILKRWPEMRVMIITSEVGSYFVDKAKNAGASAFLHKIIDYKNIARALSDVNQTGGTEIGRLQK